MQIDFLQSDEWREFQKAAGRETFLIAGEKFRASGVKHNLPAVGSYFYIPRGPVVSIINDQNATIRQIQNYFPGIIELAKENNAGWIRIDPDRKEFMDVCAKLLKLKAVRAPHDMQPKEILVLDISKNEEDLLAEMKPKTRYNINLSRKRGVSVKAIFNKSSDSDDQNSNFYINEFMRLVKVTAKRDKITCHPESYYRKMFEIIPGDILKLYIAEYNGKVAAANIVVFCGDTATYLHGASDNEFRNAMAPYLLQWQAITDAKKAGFARYDLGGVKSYDTQWTKNNGDWSGITRFKTGFAPNTNPIEFPGSYDIILNPFLYNIYRLLQKVKSLF